MKQNFHRGDLVRTFPEYWNDFGVGFKEGRVRHPAFWAIIMGSYRDQYGGGPDGRHDYTIMILNDDGTYDNTLSWYHDSQIDFLVQARCDEQLRFLDRVEEEEDDEFDEEETEC